MVKTFPFGDSLLKDLKIHTDQRPSLKQDTLISLMTIKFNSNSDCYSTKFSENLLTKCKKATSLAVKASPVNDEEEEQLL